MQFTTTTTTLLSLLSATSLATGAAITKRATLQPWQVTAVNTFSPAGIPPVYPWLRINATIHDPNSISLPSQDGSTNTTFPPSTANNCLAIWNEKDTPFGRRWPCDEVEHGYWFMEVVQSTTANPSATENFDLKFTRVVQQSFSDAENTYQGQGHFAVGVNMEGTCGGSGVCSWGLREEDTPVEIQQAQVSNDED